MFSPRTRTKPGPKGPSQQLIHAIVELKRRNPDFGWPRIATIIAKTFGVAIDKDIGRRVLAKNYRPQPGDGPSWLTFIGHMKDSLWSIDLFRCESITLKSHWVLVVMDHFTRRIIGFGVHVGNVNGFALCQMSHRVIAGSGVPSYLSSDHDPLFEYHRWKANLRVLGVDKIKTMRIPRSYLVLWNTTDLEGKLEQFRKYYNDHRVNASLHGNTSTESSGDALNKRALLHNFRWKTYCRDLVQLPLAA